MAWYMWIPVIVIIVLIGLEVRGRVKKRRAVPEITELDKAQALLRLKQEYERGEITDEEYFLERTRLVK